MNEKIALRDVCPDDLDAMYRWETDPAARRVSFGSAVVTREMLWAYIQGYTRDLTRDGQVRMIVTLQEDGCAPEAVGAVDLTDYDQRNRRAQVGIVIDADFRGKGFGRAALRLLERYCRSKLGLYQLYAIVGKDNAASLALFSSAGYVAVAELPDWILTPRSTAAVVLRRCLEYQPHAHV